MLRTYNYSVVYLYSFKRSLTLPNHTEPGKGGVKWLKGEEVK
jgi:hypothetical protein